MSHVVNTSIAAVKISGSFSVTNFSSSDEEGENHDRDHNAILAEGRRRSNAFLNSHPLKTDITTNVDRKDDQTVSNSGHGGASDSMSNSSCTTENTSSSLSFPPSAADAASEDRSGTTEQRVCGDDCQTASALTSETCSLNRPRQKCGMAAIHTNKPALNDSNTSCGNERDRKSSPESVSRVSSGTGRQLPGSKKRSLSSSLLTTKTCAQEQNSENDRDTVSSNSVTPPQNTSKEIYYRSRFNPFDRDIHLEEDHFSDNPENSFFGRESSSPASALSSQSSGLEEGFLPGDSDKVTFAELGLAEDHFSHPEGHFGFSKTEELEMAIDNCKVLISKASPNSDRQKNLIQKLVQLRMKLQELKEEPEVREKNVVLALGHRLLRKESRSTKYYCEKCNSMIWGVVQEWRKCLDCGYRCHDKCVPQITRNCAMVKVKESPSFILEICPRHPKGLLAQDYRCAECKAQLLVADGVEPRLCEYNGRYYCNLCHWNDLMYIPAQILLNWEFEKYKVCRASKQFLKLMMRKAVIKVQDINPMLFNYVEQLNDIKNLREELLLMKKYILACPAAMQAKLLLQLASRPHFVECSDRYSLQDLLDSDEKLIPELVQVHSSWAQHIKTDCELCQGRGYFCELCTSKEVLFPFDNIAVVCSSCSSVMHRICFAQQVTCPKCERRRKREEEGEKKS